MPQPNFSSRRGLKFKQILFIARVDNSVARLVALKDLATSAFRFFLQNDATGIVCLAIELGGRHQIGH